MHHFESQRLSGPQAVNTPHGPANLAGGGPELDRPHAHKGHQLKRHRHTSSLHLMAKAVEKPLFCPRRHRRIPQSALLTSPPILARELHISRPQHVLRRRFHLEVLASEPILADNPCHPRHTRTANPGTRRERSGREKSRRPDRPRRACQARADGPPAHRRRRTAPCQREARYVTRDSPTAASSPSSTRPSSVPLITFFNVSKSGCATLNHLPRATKAS